MGRSARVGGDPAANDRGEPGRLAEQQAALRRVATLVARGASSAEVFAAVAQEVVEVMHLPNAGVCRYDDGGKLMTVLAVSGKRMRALEPGSRWALDGPSMSAEVFRTGRAVRFEDYSEVPGTVAAAARDHGLGRVAGAPIVVDGRVWGVISTSSPNMPFPDDLEDRLAGFTELVAAAIANSQAHDELARLADEQAALRRVATLVAQGAAPADVFAAVAAEVAQLVPAEGAAVTRFDPDGMVTALGGWTRDGGYVHAGRRFDLEGTVSGLIAETGRPARIGSYTELPGVAAAAAREMGWRSSVAAPITVDGRLWGALAAVSASDQELPPDTEQRLAEFTELAATAIANAESHERLMLLADEQAALRRVATLVARGASPAEVLAAVAEEVGRLLGAGWAAVHRYDPDGTVSVLSSYGDLSSDIPVGARGELDPEGIAASIKRTCGPDRIESFEGVPGPAAARARELGLRSAVAAPIVVDGRLWGVVVATWKEEPAEPVADAQGLLADFTELVATAIANGESRAELDASRARIVATADATRRRIERDLHDGAQQQLLSLALEIRAAEAAVPPELQGQRAELSHLAEGLASVLDGLREIAHGIHPGILAEGGLGPALKTLANRSPIPVELAVRVEGRLPERVEVAAYYVVAEALTNAAKYAEAAVVQLAVDQRDGVLRVAVSDDGVGGADPARGSGLLGLKDRAEAIGGEFRLESPHGGGTSLTVALPVAL